MNFDGFAVRLKEAIGATTPVSYTHLDVYKRQGVNGGEDE